MTTTALSRRTIVAAAGMCLGVIRSGAAVEPAGNVEAAIGQVTGQVGSNLRPLAKDAAVFVGDTIITASQSAVAIHLGKSTLVRLGSEAKLRIDSFLIKAGTVLDLAQGALLLEHDATAGAGDTTVRSPFGLIAVRGTRFFAGPSNGVFGVFVWEGEVMVVGRNTFVRVEPGFGTDIAKPGDEPTPTHRWNEQRIKEAERKLLV